MIGDGQRVTIFFVAQQKLAFVVGAPQLVGLLPQRQGRALSLMASAPSALDQAVAIEHRVDGAAGGNLHLTGKATQQTFADLARAPVGFFPFEIQDGSLHRQRQLVSVTPGPAGTVGHSLQTVFLVAIKDLVTVLREMANSRQSAAIFSPSSKRPTKRTRSSITEHSFQGIHSLP